MTRSNGRLPDDSCASGLERSAKRARVRRRSRDLGPRRPAIAEAPACASASRVGCIGRAALPLDGARAVRCRGAGRTSAGHSWPTAGAFATGLAADVASRPAPGCRRGNCGCGRRFRTQQLRPDAVAAATENSYDRCGDDDRDQRQTGSPSASSSVCVRSIVGSSPIVVRRSDAAPANRAPARARHRAAPPARPRGSMLQQARVVAHEAAHEGATRADRAKSSSSSAVTWRGASFELLRDVDRATGRLLHAGVPQHARRRVGRRPGRRGLAGAVAIVSGSWRSLASSRGERLGLVGDSG